MSRRTREPGACGPAGGAAPAWRVRLGLGEREQSQGKLLIALKPAAGFVCHCGCGQLETRGPECCFRAGKTLYSPPVQSNTIST